MFLSGLVAPNEPTRRILPGDQRCGTVSAELRSYIFGSQRIGVRYTASHHSTSFCVLPPIWQLIVLVCRSPASRNSVTPLGSACRKPTLEWLTTVNCSPCHCMHNCSRSAVGIHGALITTWLTGAWFCALVAAKLCCSRVFRSAAERIGQTSVQKPAAFKIRAL